MQKKIYKWPQNNDMAEANAIAFFRDNFLHEYNLTKLDNTLYYKNENFSPRTDEYFSFDRKGNMLIYYQKLNRQMYLYNDKGTMRWCCRTRFKNPFKNKEGKLVKYQAEKDSYTPPFFPPQIIKAYERGEEIPELIITEGEKKAFVAAKYGFDIIGISGIWNMLKKSDKKDSGELYPEIKQLIEKCKVKKIILLHDSDALDISTDSKGAKLKNPAQRPLLFAASVKRFAELVFQEGCKFIYSYINPKLSDKKLGLDDLIQAYENYNQDVLHSFYDSVRHGNGNNYFTSWKIEYIKAAFINEIFHLNDPTDFYNYHRQMLKMHNCKSFSLGGKWWQIDFEKDSICEKEENTRAQVWEENGCYWGYSKGGNKIQVSNFVMRVLYLLKSPTEPKRIIEFKNILGQTFTKELTMDDLVSVSNFRKKLIGDGSFIFKGDTLALLNLQEILFADEETALELTYLGWNKKYHFWAWANGITQGGKFFTVLDTGICRIENQSFYLPAFSEFNIDNDIKYSGERKFRHFESDVTINEWSWQFMQTYGNNGLFGFMYAIAAIYRDIIISYTKCFPLLNLFGLRQSGKSTMALSLMSLFGEPQEAISLENESSTAKGIIRRYGQTHNTFVWLDEYKNTINPKMIGLLKNLYDGIGMEKAQSSQDLRTVNLPIYNSTILSGQDLPTADPALFTRVILLSFTKKEAGKFTNEEREEMAKMREIEKRGLTNVVNYLVSLRQIIETDFEADYNELLKEFSERFKYSDIPDRLIKNVCIVLAPVKILFDYGKITLPYSINVIKAKCVDLLNYQNNLLTDNAEITNFWNLIETMYNEHIIDESLNHFIIKDNCLFLRFNLVYAAYAEKYRKMYGKNGLDKLTLENYLKHSPQFIEVKKAVRYENAVSSAMVFKYKELGIELQRLSIDKKNKGTVEEKEIEEAF